ncbi:MAG: D-glycerate dehydrogenase [Ignavibacteriae bacterium]|nr:D-glycerate dehydrogenase [Ignavibacteriota bacterium]NOG99612.1 D-glycerate dehydrogenase [Ignavibacteriota bacterium]
MSEKTVFITRKIPSSALDILKKNGIKILQHKGSEPIERVELLKRTKNADAVISLLTEKIDEEFIDNLIDCRIIANYAVGYNNIDVEYARQKGIEVTNTPGILTDATADLTMALLLACTRRIVESDTYLREGKFTSWQPELLLGMELKGKTLGIIGAGRIGKAVVKRAAGFGLKILYFSNSKSLEIEEKYNAGKVSLNKLLKISDIISVHVPLTDKTYHLLNSENLTKIKKGAVIINTARGEIIDEKSLIKLLKSKHLFSAGLDVFENEPNVNKKFMNLKNVVLLPHIGSATVEARTKMAECCAENVVSVLKGKKAITPIP